MNYQETMQQLEALGTEQNRKVYRRHGAGENMFGVSYANLKDLRKRIKSDHALAVQLWASGNHDARVLATMIADPRQADEALIRDWLAGLDCYALTDALVDLVFKTSDAIAWIGRWINEENEWTGRAGWHLLGQFALYDDSLPDEFFLPYLAKIEAEIHGRKNRTRQAMHNALMAIGVRSARLEELAVTAAGRIGSVYIDHGETNCKTPDTVPYIQKARQHRLAKAKVA
ncbi:MAG: DNA alkylation repair protein [Chloroflexi bacterium]|nr:DNA alkylation repair protein [Chloroflexota bacterium]